MYGYRTQGWFDVSLDEAGLGDKLAPVSLCQSSHVRDPKMQQVRAIVSLFLPELSHVHRRLRETSAPRAGLERPGTDKGLEGREPEQGQGRGAPGGGERADADGWEELSQLLPVRYSPYVGLVFENPTSATTSPWWKAPGLASGGGGMRRCGAVVRAVVAGGPVACRMKESPLSAGSGNSAPGDGRRLEEEGQGFVAPGDVLVDIDGQDVDDTVSVSRLLQMLAGEPGSPVTLVFRRYSAVGAGSTHIAQHVLTVFRASSLPSLGKDSSSAQAQAATAAASADAGAAAGEHGEGGGVWSASSDALSAPRVSAVRFGPMVAGGGETAAGPTEMRRSGDGQVGDRVGSEDTILHDTLGGGYLPMKYTPVFGDAVVGDDALGKGLYKWKDDILSGHGLAGTLGATALKGAEGRGGGGTETGGNRHDNKSVRFAYTANDAAGARTSASAPYTNQNNGVTGGTSGSSSSGHRADGHGVFSRHSEMSGSQLPTSEALGNPPNRLRALLGLPLLSPQAYRDTHSNSVAPDHWGRMGMESGGVRGVDRKAKALYADAFALDAAESMQHVFDWSRYSIVSKLPPIPDTPYAWPA